MSEKGKLGPKTGSSLEFNLHFQIHSRLHYRLTYNMILKLSQKQNWEVAYYSRWVLVILKSTSFYFRIIFWVILVIYIFCYICCNKEKIINIKFWKHILWIWEDFDFFWDNIPETLASLFLQITVPCSNKLDNWCFQQVSRTQKRPEEKKSLCRLSFIRNRVLTKNLILFLQE